MVNFSKKQVFITSGIILFLVAVAGGAFAVYGERFENGHEGFRERNNYRTEGDNNNDGISRTVANTASGADITFTPVTSTDSGALSELNAEFQILKGSQLLQNSAFKADAVESSGTLRVSVTSNIPDVVKLIQEKATSGESGAFGVELMGKNGNEGVNDGNKERGDYKKEGRGHGKENRKQEKDSE